MTTIQAIEFKLLGNPRPQRRWFDKKAKPPNKYIAKRYLEPFHPEKVVIHYCVDWESPEPMALCTNDLDPERVALVSTGHNLDQLVEAGYMVCLNCKLHKKLPLLQLNDTKL